MRLLSSLLTIVGLAARSVAQTPETTQSALPVLPDSSGWGVHVLAVARDPRGALWVGTYGQGIFRLPAGA